MQSFKFYIIGESYFLFLYQFLVIINDVKEDKLIFFIHGLFGFLNFVLFLFTFRNIMQLSPTNKVLLLKWFLLDSSFSSFSSLLLCLGHFEYVKLWLFFLHLLQLPLTCVPRQLIFFWFLFLILFLILLSSD